MKLICVTLGHKWDGCKCTRCEEARDQRHKFNYCSGICVRCGKKTLATHNWDGCKCIRCEIVRDEQHRFENGVCQICGKKNAPELKKAAGK